MRARIPKPVSPEQLFNEVSQFVTERDRSFRSGKTDITTQLFRTANRVELLDPDADQADVGYDETCISITAERNYHYNGSFVAPPSDFSLEYSVTKQIDVIPAHIFPLIDPEIRELYDITEPGDLNERRTVTYEMSRDFDNDFTIRRDIRYALRDIEETIYATDENDTPDVDIVSAPEDGGQLVVYRPIDIDAITDIGMRTQTGIAFEDIIDSQPGTFGDELYAIQETASIVAVRALIRSMRTGSPVPRRVFSV